MAPVRILKYVALFAFHSAPQIPLRALRLCGKLLRTNENYSRKVAKPAKD